MCHLRFEFNKHEKTYFSNEIINSLIKNISIILKVHVYVDNKIKILTIVNSYYVSFLLLTSNIITVHIGFLILLIQNETHEYLVKFKILFCHDS